MIDERFGSSKMPPNNVDAEQSVLGGLMLSNDAFDDVSEIVSTEDFYRGDHRRIFDAIKALRMRDDPVDMVTVSEWMENKGGIDSAGLSYLGMLANNTPSAANACAYAQIVANKAVERNFIAAASNANDIVWGEGETKDKIDQAQALMSGVIEVKQSRQIKNAETLCADLIRRVNENMTSGGGMQGLSTDLTNFDNLTLGLCPADLIILAGRPSMGKTAMMLKWANAALKAKKSVLIISAEMPADQLMVRFTAMNASIDQMAIRSGKLSEEDCSRLTDTVASISETRLFIDDSAAPTIHHVRSVARKIKRQHGLDLVMIDYIQLMGGEGKTGNDRVQAISRGLKGIGKELEVPVVALSQLNRGVEQRQNKRPVMSDLRDSGAVEQDADMIVFIYRDEVYNEDTANKGTAEVNIAKQRNGPIGTVYVTWVDKYTAFDNFYGEYQQENHSPGSKQFHYHDKADRWNV